MAFVSLQGGNCYKGKTAQTSPTNESDSAHVLPVILQTYASSSTVSTMSPEQKPFYAKKKGTRITNSDKKNERH